MNPEKMRTEYGKLVYLLQDAVSETTDLGFNIISPILTVYRFLEELNSIVHHVRTQFLDLGEC